MLEGPGEEDGNDMGLGEKLVAIFVPGLALMLVPVSTKWGEFAMGEVCVSSIGSGSEATHSSSGISSISLNVERRYA